MMKRYLVFVLCALCFGVFSIGCDSSTSLKDDSESSNYYISFKVDGEDVLFDYTYAGAWEFWADEEHTIWYQETEFTGSSTAYPDGFIDMYIHGITPGTYTTDRESIIDPNGDFMIYLAFDEVDGDYQTLSSEVILTKVGEIGDTIEGTFTATMVRLDGVTEAEITDGKFKCIREAEDVD
jgi:hypothetical protein